MSAADRTHRDLLDREIGTLPPVTIDVDTLITRQRRLVRLRQAGFGGVVVAVVVLVVGTVFAFLPGAGGMRWDIDVGASPSREAVPTSSPSAGQASPTSRAAEAARLTAALQQLVSQALPGATLSKAPAPRQGELPADPLVFVDHGTHFSAAAVVTDAQGTGTITVSVGKEDSQFRSERACSSDPAPLDVKYICEVNPAPDGASMLQSSSEIGTDNYVRFYLELIRADNNAVSIDVSNGVLDGGGDPYHAQRPTPLLTMSQASNLIQDPTLATTLA